MNLSELYPEISEVQQLTAEIQELLSGLAWSYPCEPPSQRLLTHLNDIELNDANDAIMVLSWYYHDAVMIPYLLRDLGWLRSCDGVCFILFLQVQELRASANDALRKAQRCDAAEA